MKCYSYTANFGSQERQPILQIKTQSATAARIGKARTQLPLVFPLELPFAGSLLFRQYGPKSSSAPTMAVDGASSFYNPVFVVRLSAPDLAGSCTPLLSSTHAGGIAAQPAQHMGRDYATNPLLECGRIKLNSCRSALNYRQSAPNGRQT